jgi:hypothetical protein
MFISQSENDFISSATCIASSLVGASIRAFVCFDLRSILSKIGIQKDAVLPVQV